MRKNAWSMPILYRSLYHHCTKWVRFRHSYLSYRVYRSSHHFPCGFAHPNFIISSSRKKTLNIQLAASLLHRVGKAYLSVSYISFSSSRKLTQRSVGTGYGGGGSRGKMTASVIVVTVPRDSNPIILIKVLTARTASRGTGTL
jgi:hypothetical protein